MVPKKPDDRKFKMKSDHHTGRDEEGKKKLKKKVKSCNLRCR